MLRISALPAFDDNYIWMIQNEATQECAVVDPGDANPVLSWLEHHPSWRLTHILITHHHHDHTGGILALVDKTAAKVLAPHNPAIPHCDLPMQDNQLITILGETVKVITVPGHTLDHIIYFFPKQPTEETPLLFCGDTLFAAGCGRVFEGTAEQMYKSLQKINSLPPETLIYPAHEYTVSNLKFAYYVEPNNHLIESQLTCCLKLREHNEITLPTNLALEQQINPFLRCNVKTVVQSAENHAKLKLDSLTMVFKTLREWKNSF